MKIASRVIPSPTNDCGVSRRTHVQSLARLYPIRAAISPLTSYDQPIPSTPRPGSRDQCATSDRRPGEEHDASPVYASDQYAIEVSVVRVEVDLQNGLPFFAIVGLPA